MAARTETKSEDRKEYERKQLSDLKETQELHEELIIRMNNTTTKIRFFDFLLSGAFDAEEQEVLINNITMSMQETHEISVIMKEIKDAYNNSFCKLVRRKND